MKFENQITLDWYDNILKSICQDVNGLYYYCCILAFNPSTGEKIYLAVDLDFLEGGVRLKEILVEDSFKENWSSLPSLIRIKSENLTFLIKAKNLRNDEIEMKPYKKNFAWSHKILWGEYPEILENAAKIENWWLHF